MASLQEIVNKIFSLDNTKDYEFSVAEKQQQLQQQFVQNNVPPTVIVKPDNKDPETPPLPNPNIQQNSTVENQPNDIEKMKAEINMLKSANLALLQRMPIQQQEKSVEEMIYELCVPKRKE